MTLEEAVAWCEQNSARVDWGTNPRNGEPHLFLYCCGLSGGRPEDGDTPAQRFIALVERAKGYKEKEEEEEEEPT